MLVTHDLSIENEISKGRRGVIKLGLERIKSCLEYLDNPQEKFKSILIGGTNGKGSVTFYLSNLLCKFTEYKVGRYISPHLVLWDERFVIDEKIVDHDLLENISKEALEKIASFENKTGERLSEFEIYTIIAFYLFAKEKVDIACLEVGMGGRLDAINVVSSQNTLCSIITNVSLDHMKYLGKTIEKIAFEKAGIIKESNYIVTGAEDKALQVIKDVSKKLNSHCIHVETNDCIFYQDKNIKITQTVWKLISQSINVEKFLSSLQFPGRFQYMEKHNLLLDGAHNPQAAYELRKLLDKKFKSKEIVYIIGMLDKDSESFIRNLLPNGSYVICTEPVSSRATKKEMLAECILRIAGKPILANNLLSSIEKAKVLEHDLIVITGSLYLVGEALELIDSKQIPETALEYN